MLKNSGRTNSGWNSNKRRQEERKKQWAGRKGDEEQEDRKKQWAGRKGDEEHEEQAQ